MFRSLNTGAIGVSAGLAEAARLAARYGFEGVHVNIQEAASLGVDQTRELLAQKGVRAAAFGLPLDYHSPEPQFAAGLEGLAGLCKVATGLGLDRTTTWIPSWHDQLDPAANRAFHVDRLGRIARVLGEHNIRFGLEYLGPKTLRAGHPYAFVHTMAEMLALCAEIAAEAGTHNLGLLLDAWHWYTAGETLADVAALHDADIVDVHVNDAPAGTPFDELEDQVRALPGETGVIGIPAFLHGLRDVGYSGPVMVEPFSARVRALPPEEAVKVTAEALARVWREAGLEA